MKLSRVKNASHFSVLEQPQVPAIGSRSGAVEGWLIANPPQSEQVTTIENNMLTGNTSSRTGFAGNTTIRLVPNGSPMATVDLTLTFMETDLSGTAHMDCGGIMDPKRRDNTREAERKTERTKTFAAAGGYGREINRHMGSRSVTSN